ASAVSDRLRPVYAKDSDPLVRAQALATIADDRASTYLELIRPALDDPDVIVRGYANDRYSKTSDANKLATLTVAAEKARSDSQDDARLSAIQGLAAIDYPGREALLRQHHVHARGAELRHSGRRSAQRHGRRAGLRDPRRDQPAEVHPRGRGHGAFRTGHRRLAVLHHALTAAASRRRIHDLRPR